MAALVDLNEIVEALQVSFEESRSYLDLDNACVVSVSDHLLAEAEEEEQEPDILDWQTDEWEAAKRIAASDRFLCLPSQRDIQEGSIMWEFALSLETPAIREELFRCFNRPGQFRRFKDGVNRHGIRDEWFAYKTEALTKIARDWCREHGLKWREGKAR